jgi:hypothetical protein
VLDSSRIYAGCRIISGFGVFTEYNTTQTSVFSELPSFFTCTFTMSKRDADGNVLLINDPIDDKKTKITSEELTSSLENQKSGDTSTERRAAYISEHLSKMTDAELTRFEFFTRSHFRHEHIQALLRKYVTHKDDVNKDIGIVVGSLTKLFVGELMDTATEVLEEEIKLIDAVEKGEIVDPDVDIPERPAGVLTRHLEEAMYRMQREGKIGSPSEGHTLFSGGGRTSAAPQIPSTSIDELDF